MENHDIYRILRSHFGFAVDESSLIDIDHFNERFGNAIGMEIMCYIFDAIQKSRKENDGVQEFRLQLTLEKSKQFKTVVGEFIG